MSETPEQAGHPFQGDAPHWAKPVTELKVGAAPPEAINLNVEGRQVVGPLQGFGQLWQKTFRIRLSGLDLSPAEAMQICKERLPHLMPPDSRFYPSLAGVAPGEVVLINATLPVIPGGLPVSTGVMVLYADEVSFTVMTPEGHPASGFNTFSAYEEDGVTVVQIQTLERATDPIFEFGYRFMGGAAQQEKIWRHVLNQLATEFGIQGEIQSHKTLVDSRLQWGRARNIWHNAIIRTTINLPVLVLRRIFRRARN